MQDVVFQIVANYEFMNFITIALKQNAMLIYCLETQIVQFMKLKRMIFVKIFIKIRICLILVIIQKIQFFDPVNKNVTGKRKYEFKKKKKKIVSLLD